MAWRGLHLTKAGRLTLADGQIVVSQPDGEVRLPVEDVAWIVIDTAQATMTSSLISACMEAGMVLVTTDARHTPSGLILPFHRHHRQAEVARLQVAATGPLKKRLWQAIVKAKISNQAAVLSERAGNAQPLEAMVHLVGSGDPANVEARAARYYWGQMFPNFVRERAADKRNMLLNYGYAVVRSAVARAIVAAGLVPALGLNHASTANAFNLADDLVEPFRPFVDRVVWELSDRGRRIDGEPSLDERRRLAAIPLDEAYCEAEAMTLLVASERAAESLVRALVGHSVALLRLPRIALAAK